MQKKVPSPGVAPAVYWLSSGALLIVSKIGGLPSCVLARS